MPISLIAALVVIVLTLAASWSGFDPGKISVSGNHRVTRDEIVTRARIAPHLSIWLQNTRAIATRIEGIPYIETARVHRVPPSSLRIVVAERVPFAVLLSESDGAIVDRNLRVLEPAYENLSLPVLAMESEMAFTPGEYVRAREATDLRDAYQAIASRGMVPSELAFDRFGGLVVTMRDGLRLLLGGENDLGKKLTLVDAILAQVVRGQRRVAAIDVRAPGAPVLVYR
jgi:cell division protein FtsQ